MSDELAQLPIKSLELPTKTVAKLKPLAVRTIAELYAVPLPRLFELGLTSKELTTLAEAAPDFGVRWHSVDEVSAATSSPAEPKAPAKEAPRAKPAAAKPARKAAAPLSAADAEALALVSRLVTQRDTSIGGPERWYAIALVDVSRLPDAGESESQLREWSARVGALLAAHGRQPEHGSQRIGAALVFPLTAKEEPKIARLAAAHAQAIGGAPPFARPVPGHLLLVAAAGLLAIRLPEEVLARAPALIAVADGLSTPAALQTLGFLAEAYVATGRAKDGLEVLRPVLTPSALRQAKHPVDGLLTTAVVCVQAGDAALAVTVLRHAFAADQTPVHLRSLRAEALDDERLRPLFARDDFRALYGRSTRAPRLAGPARRRPLAAQFFTTRSSTRRFFCRFFSVSLGATGWSGP